MAIVGKMQTRDMPVSTRVAVPGGRFPFCNTFHMTSRYNHILLTFNLTKLCNGILASTHAIRLYWMQFVRATTKLTPWLNSAVRARGLQPARVSKNTSSICIANFLRHHWTRGLPKFGTSVPFCRCLSLQAWRVSWYRQSFHIRRQIWKMASYSA